MVDKYDAARGKKPMSPINVLVADDSQTVREVIIKTLKVAGVETHEIYEAENV